MADIATDETSELISSSKVEGTAVYSPEGDKLGTISNFMVNKLSGQVEYAVLQFGGLLGIGSDYYPLPWKCWNMTRTRAAMSSNWIKRCWKRRRTMVPAASRCSTTPMTSASMAPMA